MKYTKYHALGNDYIAIHPADLKEEISQDMIRLICHRNYGVCSYLPFSPYSLNFLRRNFKYLQL
jgi:hypothetical protein